MTLFPTPLAQGTINPQLNGLLVNWYDGENREYIVAHRASEAGLVHGSPIVTISFGASFSFRMKAITGNLRHDFEVGHGYEIVIPWITNRVWKLIT